jgi:GT2 family glycosyltransferase
MVSIGIGITTYNRPECLKECLEHIYKHTFTNNVKIYVATDTDEDRRGVAFRKNECLRSLKNCDNIFLFDDDCYPIKDGWIDFCINEGSEHLLFMDDKFHRKMDDKNYLDCGGVFMFMTKKVIDRVGAFNEKFMQYGFEHAEYSNRITGQRTHYPTNINLKDYIYAHDYSTPNHKSSITDEEKQVCIKNNWDKFFNEPIKSVFLPL